MSFAIQCPGCAEKFSVEDSDVGTQVNCACGQPLIVPDRPAPVRGAPVTAAEPILVQCTACATRYNVESDLAGKPVECECGQVLIVPQTSVNSTNPRSDDSLETPSSSGRSTPPPLPSAEPVVQSAATSKTPVSKRRKSKPTNSKSASDRKPNRRDGSDRSGNAMIFKGVAVVAAVAMVALVYIVVSEDDVPKPPAVVANVAPAAPVVESAPSEVADPIPTAIEPARRTLADRLKESSAAADLTESDGEAVSERLDAALPDNTANQQMVASGPAGPENPYAETGKDEFVQLSPSMKTQAKDAPKQKVATSASKQPAESPTAAGVVDKKPAKVVQAKSLKQIRVSFIAPKRKVRGFDRAAKAALKQFAVLQEAKSKAGTDGAPEWTDQLAVTGGVLQAVQSEVDSESDPIQVARLRLLLAWCYLQNTQYYEAGILSSDIARRTPKGMVIEPDKPAESKEKPKASGGGKAKPPASLGAALIDAELGKSAGAASAAGKVSAPNGDSRIQPKKEAAMMALTAFLKAYEAASPTDRVPEYESVVGIVEVIESNWPKHAKANDLRLHAAQLSIMHDAPLKAVQWYLRVTEDSAEYPRARLAAGQIYHTEYRGASESTAGDLREKAALFLQQGIELAVDKPELKDNFYLARLTLSQMESAAENYQAAVEYIVSDPGSLVAAVSVDDPSVRPDTGIQSQRFASVVFSTLVRSYVGSDQVEEALAAVTELETVVGDDMTPAVVQLYMTLINRLSADFQESVLEGVEDLETLTAAAGLLRKVVAHAEHASPSALLASATTATKMADTLVEEDAAVLHEFAVQIYEALLANAPEENQRALRYRMATAMRPAGRHQEAFAVFEEMLREKPKVFEVQFEAARALQAWGTVEGDVTQIDAALDGVAERPHVWGWRKMARTLQRLMSKDDAKPEYESRFLEARNAIAQCRIARSQDVDKAGLRIRELENAATEIKLLAMQMGASDNAAWRPLRDSYEQILTALGRPVLPLFEPAEDAEQSGD